MTTPNRLCTHCHREFPHTSEFFGKNKRGNNGLHSWCRECLNFVTRERAARIRHSPNKKLNNKTSANKICKCCKKEFPATLEFFREDKIGKDGLFAWCRECSRTYQRNYARVRREKPEVRKYIREYNKNRWDQIKSDEHRHHNIKRIQSEYNYKRRHVDPEYNEKCNAASRAYTKTDQGRVSKRTSDMKRAARKNSHPADFSKGDWLFAIEYFHGCCAVCGRPLKDLFGEHIAAADHWIPITADNCPGSVPHNIVPLCQGLNGCNQSKGNRPAKDWLIDRFGKGKATKILKRIEIFFTLVRH